MKSEICDEKLEKQVPIKHEKQEIEKTLIKRRYDSEYLSPNSTKTSTERNDIDTHKQAKQMISRKRQPISTRRVNKY